MQRACSEIAGHSIIFYPKTPQNEANNPQSYQHYPQNGTNADLTAKRGERNLDENANRLVQPFRR